MEEIFKDIEGYEGIYQVSNLGNIKSYNQNKEGKILKPSAHSRGYVTVNLRGNINKTSTIHRLVAEAFISNQQNRKEINHINGIKTDNRLENLEWATRSENLLHAYKTGLRKANDKKGKDHPLSIPVVQLTLDNIIVGVYAGVNEAARQTGGNQSAISNCCNGRSKTALGYKWQFSI